METVEKPMNAQTKHYRNALIEAVTKREEVKHATELTPDERMESGLFYWLCENYFLEKLGLLESEKIQSLDDIDNWRNHVEFWLNKHQQSKKTH